MNKTAKQIALLLLIGLILIAIFQLNQTDKDKKVLSYSEFMVKVANKDISRVTIENNKKIIGYYRVSKIDEAKKPEPKGIVKRENPDFETIIPYEDPELVKTLIANEVKVEGKEDDDNIFLKGVLNFLPWLLFFGFIWFIMIRQIQSTGNKALSFGKSKAKLNPETKRKVTFADVAGVDEAKEELREIVEFLKEPKKFINIGAKIPTGVLLMGPPGTGKTLLARAIAGEAGVPFFSISGSDFVEMFVGVGASRVRDLFDQGKKSAPCIIFIDEIDAVGRLRGAGLGGGHDEREQTLNQLLVEMDGFDSKVGVILMAATNRPEILDPALLRPGRFDRHILVDRPDKAGRADILRVHLKKVRTEPDVDVENLAAMTPGMVGADLANLVNEAALLAVRRNKKLVGMSEFQDAVERIIGGLEKKNRLINKHEREVVAHHEMGHAIVAMSLPGTDPVQKISIIPRGIAALGYTMQVPTEDRYLMSKNELLNKIASLLGGRAAEEIVFKDVSTGAHNDLSRATDIAKSMIKEYGMSTTLGQVYLAHDRRAQFLEGGQGRGDYSEATSQAIDKEIQQIISSQYEVALGILKAKNGVLAKGAQLLLEKEKIDHEEIKALMDGA